MKYLLIALTASFSLSCHSQVVQTNKVAPRPSSTAAKPIIGTWGVAVATNKPPVWKDSHAKERFLAFYPSKTNQVAQVALERDALHKLYLSGLTNRTDAKRFNAMRRNMNYMGYLYGTNWDK